MREIYGRRHSLLPNKDKISGKKVSGESKALREIYGRRHSLLPNKDKISGEKVSGESKALREIYGRIQWKSSLHQ